MGQFVNALDGVSKIRVLSWKLNRSARLVLSCAALVINLFPKMHFFVHRTNGTTRSDVERLHSIKVCWTSLGNDDSCKLFSHIQFRVFKEDCKSLQSFELFTSFSWIFQYQKMLENGILFPEFTSCYLLSENPSWPYVVPKTTFFIPQNRLRKQKALNFPVFEKFEAGFYQRKI